MNIFIKINQDGSAQFVDSTNKAIHSIPHFQTATKYALTVKIVDSDNANLINADTTYSVALGSNVANQLPLAVSEPTTKTADTCLASINTSTAAFRTVINQDRLPGYLEVKGTNTDLDVTFRALLPCLLSGAAHAGTDLPEEWVSDYYTKTELDALIGDYTKFNEAITAAETATTKASEASDSALAAYGSEQSSAQHLAAIENIYDNFDDRYLGAFAIDPTVDNDGNALLIGAIYFNTVDNETKFYNGGAWESPEATTTQAAQTATTKASEATTAVDGFDQHAADKIAEIEALLPTVEAYS